MNSGRVEASPQKGHALPGKDRVCGDPADAGMALSERDTMRQGCARWLTGLAIVTAMAASGLPAYAKETTAPVNITSFSGAYLAARVA
ncbi:MAG: hypothetical protein E5X58_44630, partial [Mesorhizobium sp.]